MRSRFIRIYTLRMKQSWMYITLHLLSEKSLFPWMKMRSYAYFFFLIEPIGTPRKISKGWLYNLDTIRFFLEHIYFSRVLEGQLRTCLICGWKIQNVFQLKSKIVQKKWKNVAIKVRKSPIFVVTWLFITGFFNYSIF